MGGARQWRRPPGARTGRFATVSKNSSAGRWRNRGGNASPGRDAKRRFTPNRCWWRRSKPWGSRRVGGSKGPRTRLGKRELQRFADTTGRIIEVCPYPPGTSKWNKIEHRLFCHIPRNWRGLPPTPYEVVVNLVSATRPKEGLTVHGWLDEKAYPKGRKVSAQAYAALRIRRNKFHGDWNYEILPRTANQLR